MKASALTKSKLLSIENYDFKARHTNVYFVRSKATNLYCL